MLHLFLLFSGERMRKVVGQTIGRADQIDSDRVRMCSNFEIKLNDGRFNANRGLIPIITYVKIIK